jgi:hypothetical protein
VISEVVSTSTDVKSYTQKVGAEAREKLSPVSS